MAKPKKPKLEPEYVCKCHLCGAKVIYPLCPGCEEKLEEHERKDIAKAES